MTKHPKSRDERLYIDAKKKAKKQHLRPRKAEDAQQDGVDFEE